MRTAMAQASVGDDVYGEDPTVNLLQEEVAAVLGKQAALFVPSGTTHNTQFPIPNVPAVAGLHMYAQAAVLGSPLTALGAISSNGGDMRLDVN